jgi:hypothetical protein
MLPLKTTIDIPIVISYMMELQRLNFGLQVVTSNLQTPLQLVSSKKFRSLAMVAEIEVTFPR